VQSEHPASLTVPVNEQHCEITVDRDPIVTDLVWSADPQPVRGVEIPRFQRTEGDVFECPVLSEKVHLQIVSDLRGLYQAAA
jgi:hypothetical protein